MSEFRDELDRVSAEFQRRGLGSDAGRYSLLRSENLARVHAIERAVAGYWVKAFEIPCSDLRLLDVGCGSGEWYWFYRRLGVPEKNLAGIDLIEERVKVCREGNPRADVREGPVPPLPWGDGEFDVVCQFMLFSSVLDRALQRAIASEMWRVLRPGGAVIWCDLALPNPGNPSVVHIPRSAIKSLFPEAAMRSRRVALLPHLSRVACRLGFGLERGLEELRLFNSHRVAILRKEVR